MCKRHGSGATARQGTTVGPGRHAASLNALPGASARTGRTAVSRNLLGSVGGPGRGRRAGRGRQAGRQRAGWAVGGADDESRVKGLAMGACGPGWEMLGGACIRPVTAGVL